VSSFDIILISLYLYHLVSLLDLLTAVDRWVPRFCLDLSGEPVVKAGSPDKWRTGAEGVSISSVVSSVYCLKRAV
jgi:hypothetical protein